MRMLDNSSAEIRWRLTGKLGVLPVDVAGEPCCRRLSVFSLAQRTGWVCYCCCCRFSVFAFVQLTGKLRVLRVDVPGEPCC